VKNTLKMGLVGLPNVGKSSLFNLLTKQSVAAENFPFCTIDPSEAKCTVPDQRFQYLADLWNPPSKVPAMLSVWDIAGLIKGASEGAGLGNDFLSHIASVDGIFHVMRCFEDEAVVHVDDSVDPVRDLETIQGELCAKDLKFLEASVEKEVSRVRKEKGLARAAEVTLDESFVSATNKVRELLEAKISVYTGDFTNAEVIVIAEKLELITTKPMVYIVNLSKRDFIKKRNKWLSKIMEWVKTHGGGTCIPMSIEFEEELYALRDYPDQAKAFLDECTAEATALGLTGPQFVAKSALPRIIKTGFKELNLINFLTAGEKEVRAWTVFKGALAPQAAGVIHTDFERGFIKAEIASFDDFKSLHNGEKSMAKLKEAGRYRQEGKTYVMQDADIVLFQFNVTAKKK
jgi:GTP-binding protein YchF